MQFLLDWASREILEKEFSFKTMACKLLNKKINNTQDLAVVVLTTSKREKNRESWKNFCETIEIRIKRIAYLNKWVVKLNSSPAIFLDFYPFTTKKKKEEAITRWKLKRSLKFNPKQQKRIIAKWNETLLTVHTSAFESMIRPIHRNIWS